MAEHPVDINTRLAAERTRLASERTLMAWIRTSTSLIAFGFTIFKFFQYLAESDQVRRPVLSPWVIGMMLIVLGLVALTLAWFQHRAEMTALKANLDTVPFSVSSLMAGLILVMGILALVVVVWRL